MFQELSGEGGEGGTHTQEFLNWTTSNFDVTEDIATLIFPDICGVNAIMNFIDFKAFVGRDAEFIKASALTAESGHHSNITVELNVGALITLIGPYETHGDIESMCVSHVEKESKKEFRGWLNVNKQDDVRSMMPMNLCFIIPPRAS